MQKILKIKLPVSKCKICDILTNCQNDQHCEAYIENGINKQNNVLFPASLLDIQLCNLVAK